MTWEETIEHIRKENNYKDLVRDSYFSENLAENVKRFVQSSEWSLTLELLSKYSIHSVRTEPLRVLDLGCGNGISSIAFALRGFRVDALEPDPSKTVGSGAVKSLVGSFELEDLVSVHQSFAEDVNFSLDSFDVVYSRQAMHHANDLKKFISEGTRALKKGGLLVTIRDHVIYDEYDKKLFFEAHPLHKFYGGENAFTKEEYIQAIESAGLKLEKVLAYYDSEINYAPLNAKVVSRGLIMKKIYDLLKHSYFFKIPLLSKPLKNRWSYLETFGDEKHVKGRMYSFVARKL